MFARPRVGAPQPMQRSLNWAGRLMPPGVSADRPEPAPTGREAGAGRGRPGPRAARRCRPGEGGGGAGAAGTRWRSRRARRRACESSLEVDRADMAGLSTRCQDAGAARRAPGRVSDPRRARMVRRRTRTVVRAGDPRSGGEPRRPRAPGRACIDAVGVSASLLRPVRLVGRTAADHAPDGRRDGCRTGGPAHLGGRRSSMPPRSRLHSRRHERANPGHRRRSGRPRGRPRRPDARRVRGRVGPRRRAGPPALRDAGAGRRRPSSSGCRTCPARTCSARCGAGHRRAGHRPELERGGRGPRPRARPRRGRLHDEAVPHAQAERARRRRPAPRPGRRAAARPPGLRRRAPRDRHGPRARCGSTAPCAP